MKASSLSVAECQVPDCNSKREGFKPYNVRCRICQYHAKLHSLVIDGKAQRFCQQCNRFHELSEFDGNHRGCRRKLAKHNARRTKKQPDMEEDTGLLSASRDPIPSQVITKEEPTKRSHGRRHKRKGSDQPEMLSEEREAPKGNEPVASVSRGNDSSYNSGKRKGTPILPGRQDHTNYNDRNIRMSRSVEGLQTVSQGWPPKESATPGGSPLLARIYSRSQTLPSTALPDKPTNSSEEGLNSKPLLQRQGSHIFEPSGASRNITTDEHPVQPVPETHVPDTVMTDVYVNLRDEMNRRDQAMQDLDNHRVTLGAERNRRRQALHTWETRTSVAGLSEDIRRSGQAVQDHLSFLSAEDLLDNEGPLSQEVGHAASAYQSKK